MLNAKTIPHFVFSESAYILPIIGIMGFYKLFKERQTKLGIYLLLWSLLPFLAISFFAKIIFPRYLIFFGSLFLIPTAYFIAVCKNKLINIASIGLFMLSVIYFNYTIIYDQKNIPFPEIDKGQYIEGKASGYGVPEIIEFARAKAKEKPVILLAEGNFGLIGDMLDASLRKSDRAKITVKGYWPLEKPQLIENLPLTDKNNVYAVFSHRTEFYGDWPIILEKKLVKPGGKSAFHLFKLTKVK